ncbi:MAG: prefoldin subunit alpha [Candidatus Micrarchaeota archaeon]|nr:prefoldin subunit alpha [Candidatus Micrarchaeota archaeon]
MAERQEELNQLQYLYNVYAREYESLGSEIANYMNLGAAMERNIEALEKMGTVENSNVLLGLEGGTFIEASMKKGTNVIANVGAGFLVEMDRERAKKFVSDNSGKVEESVKELMLQRQKIEKEISDLANKINSLQQQ